MLPKANRLKLNGDFRRIFKYGKTSENEFVRIKFLKNFKKHSRFGFIVSNEFARKAAVRNLFRRRLRAAAYFLLKNIKPGLDIAVWPKTALKKISYQALLNNFRSILTNNDILSV